MNVSRPNGPRWLAVLLLAALPLSTLRAQEESLRPGINKAADVEKRVKSYEREDRDVVQHCDALVDACALAPGMDVADVGAGSGLFTRRMAAKVGPEGRVYAIDISAPLVKHTEETCAEQELKNVTGVVCTPTSSKLPPDSIDLAFVCDTYHHFEFPFKMLASIYEAIRPGGRLIVVDYEKQKGVSSDWVLGHIRADKPTVIREIRKAGFSFVDEADVMEQQYVLRFQKPGTKPTARGR
jgi:predicted methyltransferase